MLKIEQLKTTKSQRKLDQIKKKKRFFWCASMQIGDVYGIFNLSVQLPLTWQMQISVIYVLIMIWEKLTFIYYCTGNKDEIFIYNTL